MTTTNTAGYVAAFPIPEVVMGINAFTLGMRRVNPRAETRVVWVNSWYDPGKEGDAAKALIDQGVDIITQHTDSPAPLQVAEQRGIHAFGQASNMSSFAPSAQLTAIVDNWDKYYVSRVKAVMDDSWASEDTWAGIKSGMVELAPYGDAVPADVRAAADSVKASIVDGSFHPFQGPFNNQAGEPAVKQGEVLDDGVLLGMDWYVEGVQGDLPN
jgi:simple sugar transport system substrate-binding protein